MDKLELTDITYEGAILDAIQEAHRMNVKVVKLGIPLQIQKELIFKMRDDFPGKPVLKEIYGIKVIQSKTLQITTEFSRYKRRKHD